MQEKERPRFALRFGLRTLFVAMTVLCCYLAWEANVVHQRRRVLTEMASNSAFQFTTAQAFSKQPVAGKPAPVASVSWVRALLGDQAVQTIEYRRHTTGFSDRELARVTRAFPEANMQEVQEELMIPCHPGCFPAGTLVETPQGLRPIESIAQADEVTVVLPGGERQIAQVQVVFTTENELWKVTTDDGELFTTQTQPLCLTDDTTKAAGQLQPGDQIVRRDAQEVRAVKVLEAAATGRLTTVYNVVLGDSQIFVAGGFLARSKPPAEVPLP